VVDTRWPLQSVAEENGHVVNTVAAQTHPFDGPLSGTALVSRYEKGRTNLDFTEARVQDSEWQWHQLDRMQVCTSLQTDNHASTPPLSFYSFLKLKCTKFDFGCGLAPDPAAAGDLIARSQTP